MEERELRDRFLKYSQNIYGLVTSSHSLTLEELISAINKYEEAIKLIHDNDIDVLVRKIKGFSIGVDQLEFESIKV